jgi:hypothetical protein
MWSNNELEKWLELDRGEGKMRFRALREPDIDIICQSQEQKEVMPCESIGNGISAVEQCAG